MVKQSAADLGLSEVESRCFNFAKTPPLGTSRAIGEVAYALVATQEWRTPAVRLRRPSAAEARRLADVTGGAR